MVYQSSCLPHLQVAPLPTLKEHTCDTQIVSEISVDVSNTGDIQTRDLVYLKPK